MTGSQKGLPPILGPDRIASMAGGTSTCATNIVKLRRPDRLACQTAKAVAGAVVSKPTAKKTTSR